MGTIALALAAFFVCSTSLSEELRTDCPAGGKDGVAALHRDWQLTGRERDGGDPDFSFRQDLGKCYDITSRDLSLFDDFDPS